MCCDLGFLGPQAGARTVETWEGPGSGPVHPCHLQEFFCPERLSAEKAGVIGGARV